MDLRMYPGLLTPVEVHNVQTPEAYLKLQEEAMHAQRARFPKAAMVLQLHDAVTQPEPFVSGGKWVVQCVCGNAPSVHPDWKIARCLECGAVYSNLVMPTDQGQIESALVVRAMGDRHWNLPGQPKQTVEELQAETALLQAKGRA